ncbi:hypothetical protein [Streptomyces goshikiensis]|uniref:hypothetical protein n=1 Tax=Streptomyces goshikiensis TaxID=1942 RepID=UPI0036C59485
MTHAPHSSSEPDLLGELADQLYDALWSRHSAVGMPLGSGNPRDQLRPVVAALLGQAAAHQWVERQIEQTGIKAMDFRNGAEMDLEPARELLAVWAAAAQTMLGDAPNYTEGPFTTVEMGVKIAERPDRYTLVVQRHGPGVLTPHEARQQAEQQSREILQIVSDWRADYANDETGDDLSRRLADSGHILPMPTGGW